MKKLNISIIITVLTVFSTQNTQAQFWKKLKKKAEKVVTKKIEKTISSNDKESKGQGNENHEIGDIEHIKGKSPNLWRNYRFIPGENVIFYDNLATEEVGEFPSRWDLIKGNAEVAELDGEKVIILTATSSNIITPLFKTTDYLGDEFTIEYDILIPNYRQEKIWWMENNLYFNSKFRSKDVNIQLREQIGKLQGWASNNKFKIENVPIGRQNDWHHIAISYNKGRYKMYYDSKRISNIPKFDIKPDAFALNLYCNSKNKGGHPYLAIKNIRIAHGGSNPYKRIVTDGKYITNGIIFNTGKAEIKKPSLGIINKIVKILKDNKDWNFEIIGHTDSDGDEASNLKLSTNRAEAVKKAIIEQGIKAERLTTVGKGESEPLNNNSTKEEKANNRRVAFIKK